MVNEVRVEVSSDSEIVTARQHGRALAEQLGFASTESVLIATTISELARNIVRYAKRGEIILRPALDGSKHGIVIVACDKGPGIADLRLAMQEGYSTSGGLGLGLPGVRRIMDEFEIVSDVGRGTTVTVSKWKR